MPQPPQPPNRSPFLDRFVPSSEWAHWFTHLWSSLVSRQFYIPVVAGAPTFTPEDRPGFAAMVYDTTNDKIYIYNPETPGWVGVTLS
jgi:hypothetical protein